MLKISKYLTTALVGLLASAVFTSAQAQSTETARFLSIAPPEGLPIIPVLEGWIANADGTTSFSFGVINRNEEAVDIPIGENNRIEPAKYQGIQPTHFPPGRTTGYFAVTVPASEQDDDVWWYIKTGDAEELKVPGRRGSAPYELDFVLPRPQGAIQPLVGIGENGELSRGIYAQIGDYPGGTVRAGEQVELVINVRDESIRDTTDPRFREPLPMGVEFFHYQGPGEVTFETHPDAQVPESRFPPGDPRFAAFAPSAAEFEVPGPAGVGRIFATFSEPGEYIVSAKVDIHSGTDSSDGDQCCWSNVFQRVTVR